MLFVIIPTPHLDLGALRVKGAAVGVRLWTGFRVWLPHASKFDTFLRTAARRAGER